MIHTFFLGVVIAIPGSMLMATADNRRRRTLYNQRSQLEFDADGLYGSKASIVKKDQPHKYGSQVEDPSCDYHLEWLEKPENVLLMKKFHDDTVTKKFKEIARWLIEVRKIKIIIEPTILKDPLMEEDSFKDIACKLNTWNDDSKEVVLNSVDVIICIGGDGTLLYTSSMFQKSMPPIMSFHMGSLGFLTPFQLDSYQTAINRVFDGNPSITLRHRLICEIQYHKQVTVSTGSKNKEVCKLEDENPESARPHPLRPVKFPTKVLISTDDLKTEMLVMNEVVVDRGPSPYLTNLELFCNGRLMTSVQGDGIIIATPTGSTAYSLAAGSSMVHPSVPCMLVTPICPHSLSFRSIVVPAGVEISIKVAVESRNTAWVAFDGRNRQEIVQGDSVVVNTSPSPVPSVNNTGHVTDWFDSLAECLQWNVRKQQKALT